MQIRSPFSRGSQIFRIVMSIHSEMSALQKLVPAPKSLRQHLHSNIMAPLTASAVAVRVRLPI